MEIQKDYISVLSDTIHSYLTGIRLYLEGYPLSGNINNDSLKVLSMMENDFKTLRAEWNTKDYLYKELRETLHDLYNQLSNYDTVLTGNFQSDQIFKLCSDYLDAMEEDKNRLKILTPEPQAELQQEKEVKDLLPDILQTDEAIKIFQKAIDSKLIEVCQERLKWLGTDHKKSKAQLAYLCGKIYGYEYSVNGNVGQNIPYEQLERLFSVSRLDRALQQVFEAQKPQRWRSLIDKLFKD